MTKKAELAQKPPLQTPQKATKNALLTQKALVLQAQRELARLDFKAFLLQKWQHYNKATFNDNWHFDYLSKILENTLPPKKDEPKREIITRAIINMPPSYGKTETIARSFIAWALGQNRKRKIIYISYSDELCRKISNQVRDLLKSSFWANVFSTPPQFLQDNSAEFVLKEGGGLFVTTLKSAITGFHADSIFIDDPIKVSGMSSRLEREAVKQNFKESVLSRLQNTQSNITILMQRLGDEDLCGFLLDSRHFSDEIINQWQVFSLKALENEDKTYKMGDFSYFRAKGEPLFPAKHTKTQLENLRLQMGNDEFSTQYLQEPLVSEAGYFEECYFKIIPSYEVGKTNDYIFVDNAMSVKESADNRAISLIGVENHSELKERYVLKDCIYGIFSEEQTISHIIEFMLLSPSAKVFIESDGGGLTLERLLQKEIIRVNAELKRASKDIIKNQVECYTPSRKVQKVEKIKALRPYYNTGGLVFLATARGLSQIKKELLSFNPTKPFRKDDCIDTIASCIAHEATRPPSPSQSEQQAQKSYSTQNQS
ncbi:hypothetical protein, partial [Helicobacter sp. T3_23-1056]